MNSVRANKVLVAMSGGVDSSVAALLLKESGYNVEGVTLRLWVDPFFAQKTDGETNGCCSRDAIYDAQRVAERLQIPHFVVDLRDEFYERVVCNFTAEYLEGRTPNPCIECNRTIKFSLLREIAHARGVNFLATGHYARIVFDKAVGRYRLLKSKDHRKDQSYMLYILGQGELSSAIFPLGELTKARVREIAAANKLEVAAKRESQDICFISRNDYRAFVDRECPQALKPGDIISTSGRRLGRHRGIAFYTVGQRKGLGLALPTPQYVVRIDAGRNLLVVGDLSETYSTGLLAGKLNFVIGIAPTEPMEIQAKIRYRSLAVPAILHPPCDRRAKVTFNTPQKAVTPGQSAVFYSGEEVIGGGVIESAFS